MTDLRQLAFDQKIVDQDRSASEYFEAYMYDVFRQLQMKTSTQAENYTTQGVARELVVSDFNGSGSALITLAPPKDDGDEVFIKRIGDSDITYSSTASIDEVTTTKTLSSKYDSVHLMAEDSKWYIIADK